VNQSTTFTAQFAPTTVGVAAGSIAIASTATNPTVSIALAGTGVQGNLKANPTSINFGALLVGASASVSVTLTNSGTASVAISAGSASGTGFSMTGLTVPLTLNAGQSTSFTAKFSPTAAGSTTGSISIVSNAPGSPLAIALSGSGTTSQPQLTINPASVAFGSTSVGSSGTQTVTLTNAGTATLTVTAASPSGTGFSMSGASMPMSINAGSSASFSASFKPTSVGAATGSISIVSNAPGSPATIALSGTGTQAQLNATPSSAAFGNVTTGTSNSQTVSLTNSGSATVTISSVTVTGGGFSTTGITVPVIIAAGKAATFNAVFGPSSAGSVTGTITLVSNAPNSPLSISLSGTGVAATRLLGLSTSTLNFGNVSVGNSNSLSTTLTNNGNSNVLISSVNVSGTGFSAGGLNSGETLTPSQSVTVTAQFAPTAAGLVSGSVSIASNATNSPSTITVSGTGASVSPHSVAMSWTASTSTVSGYNIYRGTTSNGPYPTKLNSSLVTAVDYTDSTVATGTTYYYVVTSVDSSNVESVDSNQATAIIP
jgi:hypothetical protein